MKQGPRRIPWGLCAVFCGPAMGAGSPALVYPSGPAVPENLLRIELRFARPLQAPLTMDQVHLLGQDGHPIEGAFLDLPLPNADSSTVTLLLHPGRLKSGVGANLQLGRALQAGASVTLIVDAPRGGKPLRKTWQVVEADVAAPVPASWKLNAIPGGSALPLVVQLDAAISSTAAALIAVRGPDGKRVEGRATLADAETSWRFVPRRPWKAGRYTLMTHPDLEDPAGNRACSPFEVKRASQAACEHGTLTPFTVVAR